METTHVPQTGAVDGDFKAEATETTQQESNERKTGIDNLLRFLRKAFKTDDINDSEIFVKTIAELNESQLKGMLLRMNGLINNIPSADRSQPDRSHRVSTRENEQVYSPPDLDSCEAIFKEAYEELQLLSSNNTILDRQRIALLLFHLITNLHYYADGNGRTARLAYTLFTPCKKRFSQQDLVNILLYRPKRLDIYHDAVQSDVLFSFLEERGIEYDDECYDKARRTWKPHIEVEGRRGFDTMELGFMTAYDAMTPKEREQFAHYYPDEKYYYFIFDELPNELKLRINSQHNKSRESLARAIIIDFSINEGNWSPDRMSPLYEGWGYDSNNANELVSAEDS